MVWLFHQENAQGRQMTDDFSPQLSICVPTYNRASLLKECLNSIRIAAERCLGEIELVISDNASQDNTTEVVTEFRNKYPWVQYYRNPENIGAERNFFAVAAKANGDYLWIFSDDDKMSLEGISTVLQQIKAGHEMIICNYSVWSRDICIHEKVKGTASQAIGLLQQRRSSHEVFWNAFRIHHGDRD